MLTLPARSTRPMSGSFAASIVESTTNSTAESHWYHHSPVVTHSPHGQARPPRTHTHCWQGLGEGSAKACRLFPQTPDPFTSSLRLCRYSTVVKSSEYPGSTLFIISKLEFETQKVRDEWSDMLNKLVKSAKK